MAYMEVIVRASQNYDCLGWIRYDSALPPKASSVVLSGNRRWSVINVDAVHYEVLRKV